MSIDEIGGRAYWWAVFENDRWAGHPEHLGDILADAVYWAVRGTRYGG